MHLGQQKKPQEVLIFSSGNSALKPPIKCILSDMKKLLLAITYRCDLNLLQERPKRPCVLYQSCILEGSNYILTGFNKGVYVVFYGWFGLVQLFKYS